MTYSRAIRMTVMVGVGACIAALLISSSVLVAPSTSAAAASPRTVVAECFVSRIDIYTPHVIAAMGRLQQEETQERLLVLAYFAREIACPSDSPLAQCPNPLTSADSRARWDHYQLTCFPTVILNGTNISGEPGCWYYGDPRDPAFSDEPIYKAYRQFYQTASRTMSPVQIALTGGIVMEAEDRYRVDVQAVVTATDRVRGLSRIWFVLYENQVEALTRDGFSQTNLVPTHYDRVVRRAINSEALTITQSGQQQTAMRSIALDPAWDREHLGVAVLVQKDLARGQGYEVVQAASLDFAPMGGE